MGARTGDQFLKALAARRPNIWVGDERVGDVTDHPAFAQAATSMAAVFDRQFECESDCLMDDAETGEQINVSHMIPRSKADLKRRHEGLARIAETSMGLMGRTPDYMNVTFAGFAGERAWWEGPDRTNVEGHANLVAFQRQLALEDISLTHTIVHPTIDKATDANLVDNPVPLHKTGDTEHGIVVRGARILATLAPFSDEIAVYPGHPLAPGAPPEYALSFSIPIDTPGLLFLCRDPVSMPGANHFDRPLSSRFDEQDAFVIFDDVEVPSRPGVHRRRPRRLQLGDGTHRVVGQHHAADHDPGTHQARVRVRLASRMAEAVNDTSPGTEEMLGELLGYVEVTRNAVLLAEEHAYDRGEGVWFPDARPLHPMRGMLATWFPRVAEIIIVIGSHNLLATPSRAMLDDAELRPLIDEFLHGANDIDAERRAALFRLAWDFVGSALGARNDLYERNYLASAKTNRIGGHKNYSDRTRPYDLVERMLADPNG